MNSMRICDVCESKMEYDTELKVSLFESTIPRNEKILRKIDLCENCLNKVLEYLGKLKKENHKE